jgi:drug/metabolite transporter (DMT)-like permease
MGGALLALGSAALFGASTPFAKIMLGNAEPLVVAGLLYLGSGVGLATYWLARGGLHRGFGLAPFDWPWLAASVVLGGVLAPALLMFGLRLTPAAEASLLLTLESVLTALLAWVVFRESTDRRIVAGMVMIVLGGVVLAWPAQGRGEMMALTGPLSIAAACLCWALDNNATRIVSGGDAVFIAGFKGLVAGACNALLALATGTPWPAAPVASATMLLGLLGYGVSLVLFVLALRALGTARTGAYFSTAPFIGAAIAIAILHEPTTLAFWIAGALMAVGVWIHLSEHHEHEHTHVAVAHDHWHVHDDHHQHAHEFEWDPRRPHAHAHAHEPLTHTHVHFPDLHHRHRH